MAERGRCGRLRETVTDVVAGSDPIRCWNGLPDDPEYYALLDTKILWVNLWIFTLEFLFRVRGHWVDPEKSAS